MGMPDHACSTIASVHSSLRWPSLTSWPPVTPIVDDALAPPVHSVEPTAELLIDCEKDRTLRAVLVGMLREGDARGRI